MVEHEWCGNDTVLNFCSRYLAEDAALNNETFDNAGNAVKVSDSRHVCGGPFSGAINPSIQLFAHLDT